MSGGLQFGAGLTLRCTSCGCTSLTLVGASTAAQPVSPAEDLSGLRLESKGAAWLAPAQHGLVRMAATGRTFQAYDLVEGGFVTETPRPHLWGALLTHAVGQIVRVGTAPTKRGLGGRTVALWRAAVVL